MKFLFCISFLSFTWLVAEGKSSEDHFDAAFDHLKNSGYHVLTCAASVEAMPPLAVVEFCIATSEFLDACKEYNAGHEAKREGR